MQPAKIITEMPVNIGTALYFSKVSSKIIYWYLALPMFLGSTMFFGPRISKKFD